MGFCTLGPFSGYTVYFPELFPTRLRATGCGICYNGGRFLAALAPFALGGLAAHFKAEGGIAGGMPAAATVVTCIYILGFIGTAIGPTTKGSRCPNECSADLRSAGASGSTGFRVRYPNSNSSSNSEGPRPGQGPSEFQFEFEFEFDDRP